MKKLFILLVGLFTMGTVAMADEKPIQVNQLPEKTQAFITRNFPDVQVVRAEADDDEFKVEFSDGTKMEFNSNGKWTEAKGKDLGRKRFFPLKVRQTFMNDYPNEKVVEGERNWQKHFIKVKLSNGKKLLFDKDLNVKEIDD